MTEQKVRLAPADQADRDRIADDLDTTFLVEAGAGSGKTTSLVGRLLALIESGTRVDQIAAITFTNKAADELKERFRLALEKAFRRAEEQSLEHERLFEAIGILTSYLSVRYIRSADRSYVNGRLRQG
ncbi:UvrD-helicase domain-containing protein [Paenibacillus sp. GXUN7292]|uniref:UvrD-helicase domain-containing protein n=1 Tax=Paenibacillus sp. GXUN7292 TaxID=3422499 RepID=UPI003D7ECD6B